uniref:Uncharacterized protein n=2 Tax=Felinae TaxID=338152 RepID=A0ABI7ZDU5_FELCA
MVFLLATCGGLDSGFVPSVQDFDKKLTEVNAYLQILIEQLKLFDDKIQNCKDDEQRKKIETLKETTNEFTPKEGAGRNDSQELNQHRYKQDI